METVKTVVAIDGPVHTVRVPSSTRKGLAHKVILACTCEGFKFTGRCWHLSEAVNVNREDTRAQQVRTQARLGHR